MLPHNTLQTRWDPLVESGKDTLEAAALATALPDVRTGVCRTVRIEDRIDRSLASECERIIPIKDGRIADVAE